MRTVTLHEAKTHLSRLVHRAATHEGFIITKAGRPLVKVIPLPGASLPTAAPSPAKDDVIHIPGDFDEMSDEEVRLTFDDGQ